MQLSPVDDSKTPTINDIKSLLKEVKVSTASAFCFFLHNPFIRMNCARLNCMMSILENAGEVGSKDLVIQQFSTHATARTIPKPTANVADPRRLFGRRRGRDFEF